MSGLAGTSFDPADPRGLPYRRIRGVTLSRGRTTPDGNDYVLKTPSGQLLTVGERELFLWEALDGVTSFDEISRQFRSRFGIAIASAVFLQFVADLIDAGAVERVPEGEREPAADTPRAKKIRLAGAMGGIAAGGERASGGMQPDAVAGAAPRPGTGASPRTGERRGMRAAIKDMWSFTLCNPEKFFDLLAAIFWPLRYSFWLLIPLILFAFLISMKHSTEYWADWSALMLSIPQWPALLVAEHITTWSARIVEGMVVHGYGGKIKHLDVKLFLAIFVRIHFDESSVKSMPRRQRLWIAATPLIWRLFTFSASMVIWITYRKTHPIASQIALFMAFMGLITFIVASCPLIPLYGYKFLSILIDQENLYGRAFRFLSLKMRGLPAPQAMTVAERWGLGLMALGTAVFSTLYIGHILYSANTYIVGSLNGLGSLIGLAILGGCALYFVALWRLSRRLRAMNRAERGSEAANMPAAPAPG